MSGSALSAQRVVEVLTGVEQMDRPAEVALAEGGAKASLAELEVALCGSRVGRGVAPGADRLGPLRGLTPAGCPTAPCPSTVS